MKSAIDRVLAEVRKESLSEAEKLVRIRRILEPEVDIEDMGRRALGRHYSPNRERMPEFIELFRQLLERNYVQRTWLREGRDVTITYREGKAAGDGTAAVHIKIVTAKGVEVPVEFRLHRRNERWQVYDIRTENVSLVGNYRTQFNEILANRTFDELLDQMRRTIAQADQAERREPRR